MPRKSKLCVDYKMIIIILIIIAVLVGITMGSSNGTTEQFINADTFENIKSKNNCGKCSVK